jgi:hypothetical protein
MYRTKSYLWAPIGLLLTLTLGISVLSAIPAPQYKEVFGCGINADTISSPNLDDYGKVLFFENLPPQLVNNIRADANEMRRVFGVLAPVYLIKEVGGPNSQALRPTARRLLSQLPDYSPFFAPDGAILLGWDLLVKESNSYNRTGFGIPAVLSHEFAHILQYKLGFPYGYKWQELHADYLAGWFTAHRCRCRPQDMNEAMMSFYGRGDYRFNNPRHHGTPEERLDAFMAGVNLNFCCNISSSSVAYERGLIYLQIRGAR